ncbi:unnamed protein product, partial [Ixodes persulcatus]
FQPELGVLTSQHARLPLSLAAPIFSCYTVKASIVSTALSKLYMRAQENAMQAHRQQC